MALHLRAVYTDVRCGREVCQLLQHAIYADVTSPVQDVYCTRMPPHMHNIPHYTAVYVLNPMFI